MKEKIKDLANDLELCTDNCSDRERYLVNLNQHFTKIKSKGSGLHRSKISQMTSLQQSQEFLKNQIAEHENVIELIDKPDAKYIRELINYVKQSRDTINDGFLVEEKLKNIEDNIFIKEIEIEKIKNNYIEQRSFLQKFSRGEKDSILRKSLQDEREIEEKIEESHKTREELKAKLLVSRGKEKKYMLDSANFKTVREKMLVIYI